MLKTLKNQLKNASKEEIFAQVDRMISDSEQDADLKLDILIKLGLSLEDILEQALKAGC